MWHQQRECILVLNYELSGFSTLQSVWEVSNITISDKKFKDPIAPPSFSSKFTVAP